METKEYKAVPYKNLRVFVDEKVDSLSKGDVYYDNFLKEVRACQNNVVKNTNYLKVCYQEYGCGIEGVPCVLLNDPFEILNIAKEQNNCSQGECKTIDEQWKYMKGFEDGYNYKAAKCGYSEEDMIALIDFWRKVSDTP